MAVTPHPPRLTTRNVFTLLGLLALGLIIIFNRHLLADCWRLLAHVRWYFIAAVVVVQFASYWLNALYYRSILNVLNGYSLPLKTLLEAALATNYVSYMVPSAGAAGAGYLSQILAPEVSRGESVLAQLMRSVLDGLALLLMVPIGLALIIFGHRSQGTVIGESLLATAIVIVVALALFWIVHHEARLRRQVDRLLRAVKHLFPGFSGEKAVERFLDSFYDGYRSMMSRKRQMLRPFGWSILYVFVELLTVYLVFLAFGQAVNPGIVILGYLIANIVSIFGGLLFSIGAFEVGMAGTFIALGVTSSLAVSITVVYRSLNIIISLPPGFYYYRKYLP